MSEKSLWSGVYHKVHREVLKTTDNVVVAKTAARTACGMAKVVDYDFAMYTWSYVMSFRNNL